MFSEEGLTCSARVASRFLILPQQKQLSDFPKLKWTNGATFIIEKARSTPHEMKGTKMFNQYTHRLIAMISIAAVSLLAAGIVSAQVKKGKSRAVKTAQLMKGIMKPHCTDLKKGLDTVPANDEAWEALAVNAAVINELSYILMDDGRCPDATWAEAATKTLRQGSADVLKAVEAKDLAGAKSAFGSMTKACKACHDAHRKDK
jgi:cytochrome c556